MIELDEVWSTMLAEAELRARVAGRHDIAEYLRLKATNDAIRAKGIEWLLAAMSEAAAAAISSAPDLTVEQEDGHSFRYENSTMQGLRLVCRRGVRSLMVEAGWTRGPHDGIMRGGALAVARVAHFGRPKAGCELRLVFGDDLPAWTLDNKGGAFTADDAARHIALLLD